MTAEWLPNPLLTTLKQPKTILRRYRVIIGCFLESDRTSLIPVVIPSVNHSREGYGASEQNLTSARCPRAFCVVPNQLITKNLGHGYRHRPSLPHSAENVFKGDVGRGRWPDIVDLETSLWSQTSPTPVLPSFRHCPRSTCNWNRRPRVPTTNIPSSHSEFPGKSDA